MLVLAFLYCFLVTLGPTSHFRYFLGKISFPEYLESLESYSQGGDQSILANYQVANYLKENTEPGQAIFIWGIEPMVYLMADRPCGGRYLYNDHLILQQLAGTPPEDLYPPLIQQWEENQIEYLLLLDHDLSIYKRIPSKDHFLQTKILRDYLENNFDFVTQIEDFHIYRQVNPYRKSK